MSPAATNEDVRARSAGRRGLLFVTQPRSASNLLQNMLAAQQGYQNSGYHFMKAVFHAMTELGQGELGTRPVEAREAVYDSYRKAFDALLEECGKAEENKLKPLVKEHANFIVGPNFLNMLAHPDKTDTSPRLTIQTPDGPPSTHTNPGCVPDEFLHTMQPIFQVRHPIRAFPSLLRAMRETGTEGLEWTNDVHSAPIRCNMTLRHNRAIYDWYEAHAAVTPLVIDADDVMNAPDVVRILCSRAGLDPAAVKYEWEAREEPDPTKRRFLSTINASTGIKQGLQAKGMDLETEAKKWREEFGEADGAVLEQYVRDALPDYDHLHSRRVTLE